MSNMKREIQIVLNFLPLIIQFCENFLNRNHLKMFGIIC